MESSNSAYVQVQNSSEEIVFDTKEDSSSKQGIFHIVQETSFPVPKCSMCEHKMEFSEGDVIYGDKWYHSLCWEKSSKDPKF